MRRSRQLIVVAALTIAAALPLSGVSAATSVSYQLTGTASTALWPALTASGKAAARPAKESGTWTATILNDLGAITGGTFKLTSKVRSFDAAITGGTFGPASGDCARTIIPIRGTVTGGGSFEVTVTRIGSLVNGACVVSSSTVAGTATLVYP